MPHIPGHLADFFGGSLGVAAVLLVGGWLALRWQQDRYRFRLMQTALEKGITRFPDSPPFWLVSMRQGVTMVALGIALSAVGGGAFWLGHQTSMPEPENLQLYGPSQMGPDERADRPDSPDRERPDRGPDRRPELPRPGRPPAPNPLMEQWHQAQAEQAAGMVSAGIGIILLFVGVIRVGFAQAERQYANSSTTHDTSL